MIKYDKYLSLIIVVMGVISFIFGKQQTHTLKCSDGKERYKIDNVLIKVTSLTRILNSQQYILVLGYPLQDYFFLLHTFTSTPQKPCLWQWPKTSRSTISNSAPQKMSTDLNGTDNLQGSDELYRDLQHRLYLYIAVCKIT